MNEGGLRPFGLGAKPRRRSRSVGRLRRLWFKFRSKAPSSAPLAASTWLVGLGLSIYIALFLAPHSSVMVDHYDVGEYTTRAIKAPMPFSVKDETATDIKREEARASVLPIYDFDRDLADKTATRIEKAFSMMRLYRESLSISSRVNNQPVGEPDEGEKERLAKTQAEFKRILGIPLGDREMAALQNEGYSLELQGVIAQLVAESSQGYVVSDRSLFQQTIDEVIRPAFTRRDLSSGKEKEINDLGQVKGLDEVRAGMDGRVDELMPQAARSLRSAVSVMAASLLEPNLTYAKADTEERRTDAANKAAPIVTRYEKNQLIIGEGKLVTEETLKVLNALQESGPQTSFGLMFVGIASLYFILLSVLFGFVQSNVRKFRHGNRDVLFLAAITMMLTLILWIGIAVAESITERSGTLPFSFFLAAIPAAAAAMMVRFILNSETALAFTPVAGLLAGMMADNSLAFALYSTVGSITGAWSIGRASQRLDALKAGLMVSLVGMLIMLFSSFLTNEHGIQMWRSLGFNAAGAALGGLLCALTLLAVSPVVEWIFGYTTDIKLLELASLNHPLIKEMILKAPGTYNHSILASTLAENAAEQIGVNPLLAKVAALYHDIGKISKPHYFIENQRGDANPHDKLYPRMSGLILGNHVKEGVELARDFNLGDTVAHIIQQHHGTNLIKYFYERAKEMTDPEMEQVNEDDFRYPGPKPQTREAALVMLADQVEAISRLMKDSAAARIRNVVSEHIDQVFNDGQLDESDMTLRDLHKVAESFSHVLIGIFHQRIEYHEADKEEAGSENEAQQNSHPRAKIRAVSD